MTRSKVTNERARELAAARREMRKNGAADLFDAERQNRPDLPPPAQKSSRKRKKVSS
jgi:hypothetical protein